MEEEKNNIVYMCPITKKGYDNPFEPRKNSIQNKWELSVDEIFEYSVLCDIIDALHAGEKPDPILLDMLKEA
jgi:hypothetical protein